MLKKEKPDYLVVQLITSLPLFLKLLFNIKTKLILRISGYPKMNFIRKLFWKLVSKKIHKITFPSKDLYLDFKRLKIFDEKKMIVLILLLVIKVIKSKDIIISKNLIDKDYILCMVD